MHFGDILLCCNPHVWCSLFWNITSLIMAAGGQSCRILESIVNIITTTRIHGWFSRALMSHGVIENPDGQLNNMGDAINLWQLTLSCVLKFLCGKASAFTMWCELRTRTKCVWPVWNNIASPGIYFLEYKHIKAVKHVTAAALKTGFLAPCWLFLMINYNNMIA